MALETNKKGRIEHTSYCFGETRVPDWEDTGVVFLMRVAYE
jgi:hypothetical protein